MKKKCLINHEGCNLGIQRNKNNELEIYDQWGEIVSKPTLQEFVLWLQGRVNILDSQEKSWNYTELFRKDFTSDSATDLAEIIQFLIDSNHKQVSAK